MMSASFKLYKSTATGKSTKSGAGRSPLSAKLMVGFALVAAYLLYMVFFFFGDDEPETAQTATDSASFTVPSSQKAPQATGTLNAEELAINQKSGRQTILAGFRDVGVSALNSVNNFVDLPYGASKMYLTGYELVQWSKQLVSRSYAFTMIINDEPYSINSMTLKEMGYHILYKSACLVELRSDVRSHYIYCEPSKSEVPQSNVGESPAVEMSIL